TFSGKLAYAAPEQLLGQPVDARTDLFALGLTLHELLTGRAVFADTPRAASRPPVPPPSAARPDVPTALEALVMRLVEQDRCARPSGAGEVRSMLVALGGAAAPLPGGAPLLVAAVERAIGVSPGPAPKKKKGVADKELRKIGAREPSSN